MFWSFGLLDSFFRTLFNVGSFFVIILSFPCIIRTFEIDYDIVFFVVSWSFSFLVAH